MKIINIYGGPGVGKSTAAAMIFSKLKMKGVSCELVTEYAKTLTYENDSIFYPEINYMCFQNNIDKWKDLLAKRM